MAFSSRCKLGTFIQSVYTRCEIFYRHTILVAASEQFKRMCGIDA